MIYLDSCALVKLVRVEDGTDALQAWLDERPTERLVTSEIAVAEVNRTVRRVNHDDHGRVRDAPAPARELVEAGEILAAVEHLVVEREVLPRAAHLPAPHVRTLDAIHLVSALAFGTADVELVTYDRRLAVSARAAGLTVVAPGAPFSPA
ncbi:MAG: type II toxin-antitoxin system VapC family toxin [Pseudonocardia sp.]